LAGGENRMAIGRPRQARFRLDAPRLFPELKGYALRTRPTGKIGIEVPLTELPDIRTADRACLSAVVFLERGSEPAGADRLTGELAVQQLLADMPAYGEPTDAMHERTVNQLTEIPAWRMRYRNLEDAIRILETLVL
jgi:hypothetical protein